METVTAQPPSSDAEHPQPVRPAMGEGEQGPLLATPPLETDATSSDRLCTWSVAVTLAAMCALCVAAAGLAVLLGQEERDRLCRSEQCLEFAGQLNASLDLAADPCDSFYDFICAKWNSSDASGETLHHRWQRRFRRAVIDSNRETHVPTKGQTTQQKAAMFFQSCEKIVARNSSEAHRLQPALVEAGLFSPAWTQYSELLNATLFLNIRMRLETMVQVSLSKEQRRFGDAHDPSDAFLLHMRPSRSFLEHASLKRAEAREHFDKLYHSVREYLESKEINAIPADELYALHQTTLSMLVKAFEQSDQGVASNRSEALPLVSEGEWTDLLKSCCGLTSRHVRYRLRKPIFLKEYFGLPAKLGPAAAQQYLRWFVMAVHLPVFDGPSFVNRYTNPALVTVERSRFCFRIVRSAMGAAFTCHTVLQSFQKDVIASIETLLPLVYAGFVSVFAKNAWFKPAFHAPDYRNDSGLVLGILEACKPARLEETYVYYGDMTGSFFENWRHVALATVVRLRDSRDVSPSEEHDKARAHYENNGFAAEYPYYRTHPLSADFELLPEASALPFFNDDAPLVLRLAVAGAVAADALASLLFQEYDEWDRESRREFVIQVRCHLGRRITLPELRPAQRRAMLRYLSLLALVSAAQESDERDFRHRVQGLPAGLRGIRPLFAAWCLQHCGRPGGREMCNRPLADMMLFHDAFFCGPPDAMWKDDACAVLFN